METVGMWREVGFLAEAFRAFSEMGLSVDLVSTSETNVTVTIDAADDLAPQDVPLVFLDEATPVPGVGQTQVQGLVLGLIPVGEGSRRRAPPVATEGDIQGSLPLLPTPGQTFSVETLPGEGTIGQLLTDPTLEGMALVLVERALLHVVPGDAIGVGRLCSVFDAPFP